MAIKWHWHGKYIQSKFVFALDFVSGAWSAVLLGNAERIPPLRTVCVVTTLNEIETISKSSPTLFVSRISRASRQGELCVRKSGAHKTQHACYLVPHNACGLVRVPAASGSLAEGELH